MGKRGWILDVPKVEPTGSSRIIDVDKRKTGVKGFPKCFVYTPERMELPITRLGKKMLGEDRFTLRFLLEMPSSSWIHNY